MDAVIVCTHCAGESRVASSVLGQEVQCPHCGKPTLARAKAEELPVAKPLKKELLSLDDDPPAESPPAKKVKPRRSPVRTAVLMIFSLLLTLLVMAGIYGAFRFGQGDLTKTDWRTFSPPDSRTTILMPGEPEMEPIAPEGHAVLGGKRFFVNRWFEKVSVSFGWLDLDHGKLSGVQFEQLAAPFRERELKRLNGKLESESAVNFVMGKRKFESTRWVIDVDGTKVILQVYLESEVDRRRLYFAAVMGKKVSPATPWVQKFFNSLAPE